MPEFEFSLYSWILFKFYFNKNLSERESEEAENLLSWDRLSSKGTGKGGDAFHIIIVSTFLLMRTMF